MEVLPIETKGISREGNNRRPIRIPKKLQKISYPKAFAFIFVTYLYFIGGALAAYYLWMSELDIFLKIPTVAASLFLAQQGLHLMGWVGHEGFHASLHKNKKVGAYLGIILSTPIFSFQQLGLAVSHWTHHAYTNQEKDPDVKIFGKYKNFWSRLFLARLGASRTYLKTSLAIAFGKKIDQEILLPFKLEEIKRMARVNLILSAVWMAIHISIIVNDFMFGFICIIIPHILMTLYAGIRAYIEHASTGEEFFDNTRNRVNPIFTVFYFGNNYHLEHHMYPTVPCYNLPSVHRFLVNEGFFKNENTKVVKGFLEPYTYTTSKHEYPNNFRKN